MTNVNAPDLRFGIYIHIPFCQSKCHYCDFNSYALTPDDYGQWQQQYVDNIKYWADIVQYQQVDTIFFGGGTPSTVPVTMIEAIIQAIYHNFKVADNVEISLEANPTSIETQKMADLKSIGVNRLSLGIQSFNDEDLKTLGRNHSAAEAKQAIVEMQKHFANHSFDIICARPDQNADDWAQELHQILQFDTKHLSIYGLTIAPGTKFHKDKVPPAEEETYIKMYNTTNEMTAKHGFNLYEVSNYAKDGFQCQHNQLYWDYHNWLGVGAGAHSRVTIDGQRHSMMQHAKLDKWLHSPHEQKHKGTILNHDQQLSEHILMGLRQSKGLNIDLLKSRYGHELVEQTLDMHSINNFCHSNDLILSDNTIRLTTAGILISDYILGRIIN